MPYLNPLTISTSLPSWERGLKQIIDGCYFYSQIVAPFVGAWIETSGSAGLMVSTVVAPFVGAWIETLTDRLSAGRELSLPSWERGLKPSYISITMKVDCVAPFVGAWIETVT